MLTFNPDPSNISVQVFTGRNRSREVETFPRPFGNTEAELNLGNERAWNNA
jgi:hypothetical protein